MRAVENKKAKFDYEWLETIEAGIVLRGFEVKAVKAGKASIKGAYAKIYDNELWVTNLSISPYQEKNTPSNYDPERPRKLLIKEKEITYLTGKLKEKGLTLVPVKMYNKGGQVKVLLALARSKKKVDKREIIKKRDLERQEGRTFKGR